MKASVRIALLITCCTLPAVVTLGRLAPPLSALPCPVRRIHVGDLGASNDAVRFRGLLKQQLGRKGFKMVDQPGKADAVLTGSVSISRDEKQTTVSFERASLTTTGGTQVWSGNYHETNKK